MSLLICTPMYGGMCTHGYFKSCLNLRAGLIEAGLSHDWCTITNESLIPRARNECVRIFLESDYEKMIFIDADIEFTEDDVAKLWNMEQDVAVGCYPMKKPGAPYAAWRQGKLVDLKDLQRLKGPFQVDYAGTGFMLIARSVFEKMKNHFNYGLMVEGLSENSIAYETKDSKTAWAFFDTELRNGCYLSEDYLFCERWRDMGGSIWMDPTVRLLHHGTYAYGQ